MEISSPIQSCKNAAISNQNSKHKGVRDRFCMPRVPTLLSEVVVRPWDRLRLFILGNMNSVRALKAHYFRRKEKNKGLFIWSRVPETTLPPSYPGRANFSLISLKNSTNRLHENRELVSGGETTLVHGRVVSPRQVG